ncbi:conserved hypothetical protein [Aeropyrum pernix K1]|uniref:CBS domain-containing protein n=1 Tax=Aeropyrum pernix (strain ATCC 700893 / DSM 11879 / JCM 9820 / NBRC 100138 / K1) TaxID=272557 RepID=Q9Y9W1_AERPE|nr:CBS domain-containing protein [Aeropyrum pernix]BAA81189.2 conserved hypothetical protein [Aeropyrum pernix K1]
MTSSVAQLLSTPVEEVAGKEVPVLDKDFSLAEILKAVEKAKIDRAFLTEGNSIRGVLTFRDILDKIATVRTKQAYIGGLHGSSFMNEPVKYVEVGREVSHALETMANGMFTSVPVVGAGGVVEGGITRFELARLVKDLEISQDTSVRDVMRTFLVSVNLQTRILHVRQLLYEYDISVIPVMDEGRFVGVVGLDELMAIIKSFYNLARGEPKRHTPLKYVIVADAIRMRPPVVTPDASLAEAAEKMLEKRYRAVVVVDSEKPVGFTSGLELANFLLTKKSS